MFGKLKDKLKGWIKGSSEKVEESAEVVESSKVVKKKKKTESKKSKKSKKTIVSKKDAVEILSEQPVEEIVEVVEEKKGESADDVKKGLKRLSKMRLKKKLIDLKKKLKRLRKKRLKKFLLNLMLEKKCLSQIFKRLLKKKNLFSLE